MPPVVHVCSLMRSPTIEPGTADQIKWNDNNWIIWDVGFGEDVKSSGLLMPCAKPGCFTFESAKRLIVEVEVDGRKQFRRWYQAGGIIIAAMHVIRAIAQSAPKAKVRLFEGFVSYKTKGRSSDHRGDVVLLRDVIQEPERFAACIHSIESLRGDPTNKIESAFKVC